MRQVIIARKDLNMSPGKLAAQVSHAAMAFITAPMRRIHPDKVYKDGEIIAVMPKMFMQVDVYNEWIKGSFTKTICEAKNRYQLEKAIAIANELDLTEGIDYFLIKDNCLTELEPEEVDEDGIGRTLTCIGFRPLPDDIAHKISKKFQLYR